MVKVIMCYYYYFSPISGIVTLVGCELLCGIHRVTSSINTHYGVPIGSANLEPSPEFPVRQLDEKPQPLGPFLSNSYPSSAEILQKYILGGIPWRCLVLLKALGVEVCIFLISH